MDLGYDAYLAAELAAHNRRGDDADHLKELVAERALDLGNDAERFLMWIAEHDLPANPLTERGYGSIGCWPCTRPTAPGEDRRAGRWSGSDKTECGLHL